VTNKHVSISDSITRRFLFITELTKLQIILCRRYHPCPKNACKIKIPSGPDLSKMRTKYAAEVKIIWRNRQNNENTRKAMMFLKKIVDL